MFGLYQAKTSGCQIDHSHKRADGVVPDRVTKDRGDPPLSENAPDGGQVYGKFSDFFLGVFPNYVRAPAFNVSKDTPLRSPKALNGATDGDVVTIRVIGVQLAVLAVQLAHVPPQRYADRLVTRSTTHVLD